MKETQKQTRRIENPFKSGKWMVCMQCKQMIKFKNSTQYYNADAHYDNRLTRQS